MKEIKNYKKIDLIDKKNLIQFLSEIEKIRNILKLKNKKNKITRLENTIRGNKRLFKKFNGKGINHFVGLKN